MARSPVAGRVGVSAGQPARSVLRRAQPARTPGGAAAARTERSARRVRSRRRPRQLRPRAGGAAKVTDGRFGKTASERKWQ